MHQAICRVTPNVIVKAKCVGGSTYRVPIEIKPPQGKTLVIHWLLRTSRKRPGRNMGFKLNYELVDVARKMEMLYKERKKLIEWLKPIELSHIFVN